MSGTTRKTKNWVKDCFYDEHTEENRRKLKRIDRKHGTAIVNDGNAYGMCGSRYDEARTPGAKKFVKKQKRRSDRLLAREITEENLEDYDD